MALNRGTRMIGGQFEWREASQLCAPVGHLLLQDLSLQPAALPEGIVGILDGQGGQWRGFSLHKRLIERGQFPREDLIGPAIGDDVVHRQQEHVLLLPQPHEPHPQQGTALQIAGLLALLLRQASGFLLALLLPPDPPDLLPAPRPGPVARSPARADRPAPQRWCADSHGAAPVPAGSAPTPADPTHPANASALGIRYAVLPGSNWSRNHRRCCA